MKNSLPNPLRAAALLAVSFSAVSCVNQPYYRPDGNVFIRETGKPRYGYGGTETLPDNQAPKPPKNNGTQGEDPEKLHSNTGTTSGVNDTGTKPPPTNPSTPDPVTPPVKPTTQGASLPFGTPVIGEKGYVYSPYAPDKGKVDVKDIPSGTKVECPYTKKIFRVP